MIIDFMQYYENRMTELAMLVAEQEYEMWLDYQEEICIYYANDNYKWY